MDVTKLIATAETMEPAKPLGATPEIEAYQDDSNEEVYGLAWRVTDLAAADWALRRVAECEAEAEEIRRQAEEAIAQIEARKRDLTEKAMRGAAYFRFQLTRFAEEQRDALLKGSKKSRDLIHGRIAFRSSPERLKVSDPEALSAWLAVQPVERGLYRVELKPEMRALQAQFKETGEIFPGCEVEPSRETVSITALAPEAALMKKGA
jgi:phage host-nuclease inhibitor protein Gam